MESMQNPRPFSRTLLGLLALPGLLLAAPLPQEYLIFVGTYTQKDSKGIYAWRFSPDTGMVTALGLAAETTNPSFLALHPSGAFL